MDTPITWTLDTNYERIVVPCFVEEIAPLFEAAGRFRLWDASPEGVHECREIVIEEGDEFARIRLMRELKVTLILANGIKESVRRLLRAEGIRVIHGVHGTAVDAMFGWLAGRLDVDSDDEAMISATTPVAVDMVEWTYELMTSLKWKVIRTSEPALSPIDLIAEQDCPVCGKPVRVALCCGAHAWRVDEEISEFHHLTASGYHSRLFVYAPLQAVVKRCAAYGIELLDPSAFQSESIHDLVLPPLKGRVSDHPRLGSTEKHGREQNRQPWNAQETK